MRLAVFVALCLMALPSGAAVPTQVQTCAGVTSGQAYAACTPVWLGVKNNADVILWCSSGQSAAGGLIAACTTKQWLKESNFQSYSWVFTTAGWQRFGDVTFTPVAPPPPPPPPAACAPPSPQSVTSQWAACPNGAGLFPQHRQASTSCDGQRVTYGAWLPATPPPEACIKFTTTLTASPPNIVRGTSTTLTWAVDDPLAQCVSPGGASSSGSLQVTPLSDTVYDFSCVHGYAAMASGVTVTVHDMPPFKHQCSPYPATKVTIINPIPAGVSTRYTVLAIQDCVLPGGGRVIEGVFTEPPKGTFVIPSTWLDVQPTPSEAQYGHQVVAAYRAANP